MATFEELFGPKPEYPYFSEAADHPFETNSTRFSLVNAAWLADCSLLAYLPEERVLARLARVNAEGRCFGFDQRGAQGFVAHTRDWVVVSFRGTEVAEFEDVIADVRIKLVQRPPHSGGVHLGFYEALSSIWPEMEEMLTGLQEASERRLPVWFTGHSLGAAMATLAADRCDDVHALYTVGSPRVGDKSFRQGLTAKANAYRIVNNNDGVTAVPPGSPTSPYRHVGDLKYLDEGGRMIADPSGWTRKKAGLMGHVRAFQDAFGDTRRGDLRQVNWDHLRDHSPEAYATSLWRAVQGH